MLGPMAEFAGSGQQEEGCTRCSKGATINQAGSRQAGRGRGLRWLGIPGMADVGLWLSWERGGHADTSPAVGNPMVKLSVSRPPLVAIFSTHWYLPEADFVGELSILLDAGILLSPHPSHGCGFGPATLLDAVAPAKPCTVVLWKECGTRSTGIC